jgi:hypothetical protein
MPNRFRVYLAKIAHAHFPNWFDLFHGSFASRILRFLGALVSRHEDNINADVYRKSTHVDKYLDHSSDHDNQHKVSVARTLIHRDISLPRTHERKQKELDHLGNTSPGNDI